MSHLFVILLVLLPFVIYIVLDEKNKIQNKKIEDLKKEIEFLSILERYQHSTKQGKRVGSYSPYDKHLYKRLVEYGFDVKVIRENNETIYQLVEVEKKEPEFFVN